jgi:uncharacterized protein HemY
MGRDLRVDQNLDEMIDNLITENRHDKAIEILMREYEAAKSRADARALDSILGHLVFAYASRNPPDTAQARRFCAEREENITSSYNILQTGMYLYYAAEDYQGAAAKLREAITRGKQEGDNRSAHSSLSILGLALLQLGRTAEAADVLRELEQMLTDKKPFVAGDETAFLESARGRGLEVESVKRIAAALVPLCRDPECARRLRELAENTT